MKPFIVEPYIEIPNGGHPLSISSMRVTGSQKSSSDQGKLKFIIAPATDSRAKGVLKGKRINLVEAKRQ